MATTENKQLRLTARATVTAKGADTPPTFSANLYNGGPVQLAALDFPVLFELASLRETANPLVFLDHQPAQRVGHVEAFANDGRTLGASGVISAQSPAAEEVVGSAKKTFPWQASVDVLAPTETLDFIAEGNSVAVNGERHTGPVYVARNAEITGFSFVGQGADSETSVTIAAEKATQQQELFKMAAKTTTTPEPRQLDKEFRLWASKMLTDTDLDALSDESIAQLQAQYDGQNRGGALVTLDQAIDGVAQAEERNQKIQKLALRAATADPLQREAIKKLAATAITENWDEKDFRLALYDIKIHPDQTEQATLGPGGELTGQVLEAAVCVQGRLEGVEQQYSDQVLQAAHDQFKHGIGLKELLLVAAQANGYRGMGTQITEEVLRAAFPPRTGMTRLEAGTGFSAVNMAVSLSNIANKFVMRGWMARDRTCLNVSKITSVNNFHQITTVSLTGDEEYLPVGKDGQLQSATLGEETYNNQASSQGRIFAITFQQIRNDDVGVLSDVPRRIGLGAITRLNSIWYGEFLDNAAFFTSARNNVVEGGAGVEGRLNDEGLETNEAVFTEQKDPDGNILGVMPAIIFAHSSKRRAAMRLMGSERIVAGTGLTVPREPDVNVWQGEFRVETTALLGDTRFTGNSKEAWYLLADPDELPVIEIVALDGVLEPTVETADASFDTLGIQMRGVNHVGVRKQEYRAGVRSDGVAKT